MYYVYIGMMKIFDIGYRILLPDNKGKYPETLLEHIKKVTDYIKKYKLYCNLK
jgi:hypothetical protein